MECFVHLPENKNGLCGCHFLSNLNNELMLHVNVSKDLRVCVIYSSRDLAQGKNRQKTSIQNLGPQTPCFVH